MAKREQREKMAQDLKERLGFDVVQMPPEQFAAAVDVYIGQRLREAERCEVVVERTTKDEFQAVRMALIEIMTDSSNSPTIRLRAAELLPTMVETFDKLSFSIML